MYIDEKEKTNLDNNNAMKNKINNEMKNKRNEDKNDFIEKEIL